MTATAVVTMAVICGMVWGGLALLIVHAVRSEGRRNQEAAGESGS